MYIQGSDFKPHATHGLDPKVGENPVAGCGESARGYASKLLNIFIVLLKFLYIYRHGHLSISIQRELSVNETKKRKIRFGAAVAGIETPFSQFLWLIWYRSWPYINHRYKQLDIFYPYAIMAGYLCTTLLHFNINQQNIIWYENSIILKRYATNRSFKALAY